MARDRTRRFEKGQQLWRAQHANEVGSADVLEGMITFRIPLPAKRERMIPDPAFVGEGRGNPSGVAFLYLADHPETAVAEMKATPNAHLTLSRFEVTEAALMVDFARSVQGEVNPSVLHGEPSMWDDFVWTQMSAEFSRPVLEGHEGHEYRVTQRLAEMFRTEGYAGILYRSSRRAGGTNVILFDPAMAYLLDQSDIVAVKGSQSYAVLPNLIKSGRSVSTQPKLE
ncbi:MAG: RES family NAD+ phosphorylase [Planctomycetota bacterium]